MTYQSILFLLLIINATFSITAKITNKPVGLNNSFVKEISINNSPKILTNNADCVVENLMLTQCNGIPVTPINFNNSSRTVESGTDLNVGVVYRYTNAGTAPDGTVIDALVTVVSYNNNHDTSSTTFTSADVPGSVSGFEQNLQPNINHEPIAPAVVSTIPAGGAPWVGSIRFNIKFVVTGTSTPKVISFAPITVDNDGTTYCSNPGVISLRESVTYSPAPNQFLFSTSPATTQDLLGNTVSARTAINQPGVGVGIEYANATLYINKSEFDWTYSYAANAGCNTNINTGARYGSLNMSCQLNFDQPFTSFPLSGNVFNDVNGLTDSTVNGTGIGTPSGAQLYANLVDENGYTVDTVAVNADGTYSFPTVVPGNYTVQISTVQAVISNTAPPITLPVNWANTGENIGTNAGNDGNVNGATPVTVGSVAVTNVNFGIQERPTPLNHSASSRVNLGGPINEPVASTSFNATDPSGGSVSQIRISGFPSNVTSITIGGVQYTTGNFPAQGVTVTTNATGNPAEAILIDPIDGAVTVVIPYFAIDNAGFESSTSATVSIPFTITPTASQATISGKLVFNNSPIKNNLVILTDNASNQKTVVRTDVNGVYSFEGTVGGTFTVQPLSNKYSFEPTIKLVSLNEDVTVENFQSTSKNYVAKNDFDGDGKSDIAVYRPSEGNWYVINSSTDQLSVFNFGLASDKPVPADYDGDGRTDFAVYRPSEGNWYIWLSASENLRVERFGLADDKLLPSDFDGDGKADIAVYRNGVWYIKNDTANNVIFKNFGLDSDTPFAQDFDGDGKAEISVYRPSDGNWYVMNIEQNSWYAVKFGLENDQPLSADFDGDGQMDIAQFRKGTWYIFNSTTDFQFEYLGSEKARSLSGDYDGDGRADISVFHDGVRIISLSQTGNIVNIPFGLDDDVIIQ